MPIKRFQLSDIQRPSPEEKPKNKKKRKYRLIFEWSEIIQSIILNCDSVRLVFTMQSNCSCS